MANCCAPNRESISRISLAGEGGAIMVYASTRRRVEELGELCTAWLGAEQARAPLHRSKTAGRRPADRAGRAIGRQRAARVWLLVALWFENLESAPILAYSYPWTRIVLSTPAHLYCSGPGRPSHGASTLSRPEYSARDPLRLHITRFLLPLSVLRTGGRVPRGPGAQGAQGGARALHLRPLCVAPPRNRLLRFAAVARSCSEPH